MRRVSLEMVIAAVLGVAGLSAPARASTPTTARPAAPQPPLRLQELSVLPPSVVIDRPQATQRLIVTGRFSDGSVRDLTGKVSLSASEQRVFSVAPGAMVVPKNNGKGSLTARVTAGGRTLLTRVPVEVRNAGPSYRWDFATQVAPLLTRAGCNGTACHGAANGRGGFRLSAFGHDPELDFETITRSAEGRRLDRYRPGRSLLLMKPTLAVSHAGGLRFRPNSAEYRLLGDWIAAGAPRGRGTTRLERVEVAPSQILLTEDGQQQRLLVTAHYADGTREDVTSQALLETKNPAAAVLAGSRVVAVGLGEAPILARYGGQTAVATVSSTPLPSLRSFPEFDPGNLVDREVYGRLRRLRLSPADLASDDEYVRRVYLDLIGRIPTPAELQAFFIDPRSDKRPALVDRLLDSPEFAIHWRDNVNYLLMGRAAVPPAWKAWLERSFREDRGWDAMTREMLSARVDGPDPAPSLHFLASRFAQGETGLDQVTRDVSRVFFGVDIQCARCHTHPEVASWHQSTYWGISAFFGRSYPIQIKGKTFLAEKAAGEVDYFGADRNRHQASPLYLTGEKPQEAPTPKDEPALYVVAPEEAKEKTRVPVPKYSRRARFVEMAVTPSDPYFKRAMVNWVWSQLMGRGLVEPIDQMHEGNPASHPELLASLSESFAFQGFRLKSLIRTIVTSRTYAQSSAWPRDERPSPDLYAVAEVRPLSLWQLANSTMIAAGYWDQAAAPIPRRPDGTPAEPVRPKFEQAYGVQLAELRQRLDAGTDIFQAGVSQSLYLTNSSAFHRLLAQGGLAERVLTYTVDAELIRAAYRAVLSREPSPEENAEFRGYLRVRPERRLEAVRQIVWALITSSEFRFNH